MTDLHYMSATDALAAFRARTLSPVELLEAVIARADAVEPTINALCLRDDEGARARARESEARYMGKGPEPRPLEGIPLAIKEEEAVAGQPARSASLIFADEVAEASSPFAERMLASGAIVHARTTAPEFSCAGFTHSKLYGVTRNPWNPEFATGGSSGGSGAALAAGTTTLASGSDIGGSIRIPASFNGVVGFRPPYGRVPQDPPFNLDTYCCVGPMARTVSDCAIYQNTLVGPDPRDHVSLSPALTLPDHFAPVDGMRIALSVGFGDWPIDAEITANTAAIGEALRSAGAVVEEVDIPVTRDGIQRVALLHFERMFAAWAGSVLAEHGDLANDYVHEFVRTSSEGTIGGSFLEEMERTAELQLMVSTVMAGYDTLVCPTIATRGLVAGDSYVGHGLTVGGVEVEQYMDSMCTLLFNVASRCPVLAVPSGHADNGVPTGVQIVGHPYDDVTVFRVGAAVERARPWLDVDERRPRL
jgi:Asp-tRNA(Asn)/Glu-tRNA(Gln) amidotransferase A subunit family amidase